MLPERMPMAFGVCIDGAVSVVRGKRLRRKKFVAKFFKLDQPELILPSET